MYLFYDFYDCTASIIHNDFLKYLNDNHMPVPMMIRCCENSPSFIQEKKMLAEIQNGKYKNIPNVQLCICQKNGVQSVILIH